MQTIILYGNSLAMSTIEASLRECANVQVVHVKALPADTAKWLAEIDPIAVIFDRVVTRPDFAIPLLDKYPDVLFVGLDPSSDRLVLLSGRENQPETPEDLVKLLIREAGQSKLPVKKDG